MERKRSELSRSEKESGRKGEEEREKRLRKKENKRERECVMK